MIRWSIRVSLFIALLVSLALLSQIDFFAIKRIVISGNTNIPTENIQSIVDNAIHTSYIGLFPKTNVFLYPKDFLISSIENGFPRVKKVNIYTESFNILNIRIEERVPTALWCSAIQCYVVDEGAYVYAEAREPEEQSETENLISFIGLDEIIGSEPIQKTILEPEVFRNILFVAGEMSKNNLPVQRIEFRSKDEVNFWIKVPEHSDSKKKVIFSARKDYQEAYNNLLAALKSNTLSTTTDFEYIDTRFGNKVFYRLTPTKVSTSTASSSKKR